MLHLSKNRNSPLFLKKNKFLRSAHNLSSLIRHKILPVYSFPAVRSVPACGSRQFYCFFSGAREGHDLFYLSVCVDLGLLSVPKHATVATDSALWTVCVLYSYVRMFSRCPRQQQRAIINETSYIQQLSPTADISTRIHLPDAKRSRKVLILRP